MPQKFKALAFNCAVVHRLQPLVHSKLLAWNVFESEMLALVDVEKTYGSGIALISILRGVTITINAGEFCAIVGPSGSGKSTLMNLMGLLDRPTHGSIRLAGREVARLGRTAAARVRNETHGFVFQSFQLLPRLTAWENVALPLLYRGVPKADRRAPALAMLERVGLADRAWYKPDALSGGQRQRVAIARALVGAPRLLLADEPTGSLDSETASEVLALFRMLNQALGLTIVMITHDQALAARCDRRITMLDGRIVNDMVRGGR